MANALSRLLPFASRTRPTNPFVEEFRKIAAHSLSATEQVLAALRGDPELALARVIEIEHRADESVRTIHTLVDSTFITPYDKRDIVLLSHRLDDIVDSMRTALRLLVGYRALETRNSAALCATARTMCDLTMLSETTIKQVVDEMPHFNHDRIRAAVLSVDEIEDQCDELFARALHDIFPDPNQPLTAGMLAWRDVFRLLERTTDYCGHAMGVIVSIARQEGS